MIKSSTRTTTEIVTPSPAPQINTNLADNTEIYDQTYSALETFLKKNQQKFVFFSSG